MSDSKAALRAVNTRLIRERQELITLVLKLNNELAEVNGTAGGDLPWHWGSRRTVAPEWFWAGA